jgi:hypothetical protein
VLVVLLGLSEASWGHAAVLRLYKTLVVDAAYATCVMH